MSNKDYFSRALLGFLSGIGRIAVLKKSRNMFSRIPKHSRRQGIGLRSPSDRSTNVIQACVTSIVLQSPQRISVILSTIPLDMHTFTHLLVSESRGLGVQSDGL